MMDFIRDVLWANRFVVGLSVVSGSFVLSPLGYALRQQFVPIREFPSREKEFDADLRSILVQLGQEKTHEEFRSEQFFVSSDVQFVRDDLLRQKEAASPINFVSPEINTSLELSKVSANSALPWMIAGTMMGVTTVALAAAPNIFPGLGAIYAVNQHPHLVLLDTISIDENTSGIMLTAQAWDPEGGGITFDLRGEDSGFFHIDSGSGVLSVRSGVTLDFDTAMDYNSDNQFTLIVVVTDSQGASSDDILTIELLNVDDEAPEISANTTTWTLDEGSTGRLTDISFIDDGTQQSNAQWVLNGTDKSLFNLSGQGMLSLHTPLDYENAQDANMDNVYEVSVQAFDSTNSVSNSLDFQITVNNVWEPGSASSTLNMTSIFTDLQSGFNVQFLDEISFIYNVLHRDVDGDGDSDSLLVFADNNGTAATGQQPSIMVAAFDDSLLVDISNLLFVYQDSGLNYENIRSVSAVRSANGEQGHQVTVNTTALQTKLLLSDGAINQLQPSSKVEKAVNQILLHFDDNNDGIYEGFWQLDSTGLHKGGSDDNNATTLISSELTLVDGEKYATADLDGNGESDIIVYAPNTDDINVWLSDQSGLSVTLAAANKNPMHGAKLSTLSSTPIDPADIYGIFWFENQNSNSNSNCLATFNASDVDIFSVF